MNLRWIVWIAPWIRRSDSSLSGTLWAATRRPDLRHGSPGDAQLAGRANVVATRGNQYDRNWFTAVRGLRCGDHGMRACPRRESHRGFHGEPRHQAPSARGSRGTHRAHGRPVHGERALTTRRRRGSGSSRALARRPRPDARRIGRAPHRSPAQNTRTRRSFRPARARPRAAPAGSCRRSVD